MINVELKAKEYNNVDEVRKEIRSIQSRKSRLRKQKSRSDYNELMTEILNQEQLLKEVRDYFEPKRKPVTEMNQQDISLLNLDETNKALKSIQSKKCNTQHLTENILDNIEYNKACQIEEWLLDHKDLVKPIEETVVRKSDINDLIDHLENQDNMISKQYILEQLLNLIK